MALGDAELAFFISNGIMLIIFFILYHKLYRKPEISKARKVIYAITFPILLAIIGISIFLLPISMNWAEALMFNIIWVQFFMIMLKDIAGHPSMQRIPFGRLFLGIGMIFLLIVCFTISLLELVWFLSMGEWSISLPIFIISILSIVPLLILISKTFRKVEEQVTEGVITSGGRQILHVLGAAFGFTLLGIGDSSPPTYGTIPIPSNVNPKAAPNT